MLHLVKNFLHNHKHLVSKFKLAEQASDITNYNNTNSYYNNNNNFELNYDDSNIAVEENFDKY